MACQLLPIAVHADWLTGIGSLEPATSTFGPVWHPLKDLFNVLR